MTRISLHGDLSDLIGDLREIPIEFDRRARSVLEQNGREGNMLAVESAVHSAGEAGKLYPRAFRVDQVKKRAGVYFVEYGPLSRMKQGDMEFEFGSRNQKPHLDLNRSADRIAHYLGDDAAELLDELFWPGAK